MIFVNRKVELELLKKHLKLLSNDSFNNIHNIALLGLRRTGKTFLLKKFIHDEVRKTNICCQFTDLANICNSPRDFAKNYLLDALKAYNDSDLLFDLMDAAIETENKKIIKAVNYFQDKLFISGDNTEIIRFAFEFHKLLNDKSWVIILDEFQEILSLENFKNIKSIDSLFRAALQMLENTFFIISGSYPTILEKWLLSPEKYLFSHFHISIINEFSKNDAFTLAHKLIPKASETIKSELYRFSYGNPYVLSVLAKQFKLTGNNIKSLFIDEVFNTAGVIHNYFDYVLNESLKKVRGHGVLKETLKNLALSDKPLNSTELSNIIGKSAEEIHLALKALIEIDIIYKHNREYYFQYIPFKFFLKYKYLGLESYEYERSQFYKKQINDLYEKYLNVSTELGRAKENQIFALITEHQKKTLWGVKFPIFKTIRKNYIVNDSEIDIYAETLRKKVWVFEVKYKNKTTGVKDINKFIKKIDAYRYIYISKNGFTDEAAQLFQDNKKITLIDLRD